MEHGHQENVRESATLTSDTVDEDLILDVEVNDLVERGSLGGKHLIELLGLLDGTRESVEDESLLTLGLSEVLLDDTDNDLIAHETTSIHDLLGLLAHLRSSLDSGTEHVSGGEVAKAVLLLEGRSVGSLSRSRGSCSLAKVMGSRERETGKINKQKIRHGDERGKVNVISCRNRASEATRRQT